MKVVIVGGVAGGASAAARLRRLDENAEIVVLERGEYISYANCGLPYYIGGEITDKSELILQTPESFHARFRVDVRVQNEAISIDRKKKTVRVRKLSDGTEYDESYDKLILSPGAEPFRPPFEGSDDPHVLTLRTLPDAFKIRELLERERPKSAVVAGGGAVGLEMAENLAREGIHVTLVEMLPHLVPFFDFDTAAWLHHHLREKGVALCLGEGVASIRRLDGGLLVHTETRQLKTDLVVLATGVRPESALARAAGLALAKNGAIVTDDRMQTSDPDIFAVGDAVETSHFVSGKRAFLPLAGPANRQGRVAADHIAGYPGTYGGTQGSTILRAFDLVAAATGLNEKSAKTLGIRYDKAFVYSPSHASYYPGAGELLIKLLFEVPSGRVLGAQALGTDGVDKRLDVIATVIRLGGTVSDLTKLELCYSPPFGSAKDPVNMAGFIAENVLSGKVSQFHWDEVESLRHRDDVTLLDVRTSGEYAAGHIEGAINIPLHTLRASLSRLDRAKPVYVNCQSGMRSYIACRILTQSGFSCFNLGGGYRLYADVCAKQ